MAVQKSKVTRSRRGQRRSHDALTNSDAVTTDSETGEVHRRHHMTKDGWYRGRQIVASNDNADVAEDADTAES